jgi:hypothetical protein
LLMKWSFLIGSFSYVLIGGWANDWNIRILSLYEQYGKCPKTSMHRWDTVAAFDSWRQMTLEIDPCW